MHVHRIAPDDAGRRDRHRLTELVEPFPQQLGSLGVAPAQQVHHLELRRGRLGERLGGRPSRRGLVHLAAGRLPGDGRAQRVEQDQQTAAAGVDNPGLTQHVELLRGLFQGDHRGVTGGGDRLWQRRAGVRGLLDGVTGGFEHRDDRAVHLLAAHRGDDEVDTAMQRRAEQRRVDVVQVATRVVGGVGGDVGDAPQDLGQDHPGVAPRAVAAHRRRVPQPV